MTGFKISMVSGALILLSFGANIHPALAEPQIYTGRFSQVAVQGYDPVAYFIMGQPIKGDEAFETEWKGATFRFASAENRDLFIADPDAYAPQYGGYCAWAIAQGKFAKGNAKHWRIVDGKLYLNYNKGIQKKWEANISGFIEQSEMIWPTLNVE